VVTSFDDIPSEDHGHRVEPGPRFHRFAERLRGRLNAAHGAKGGAAGYRLITASWQLRYAGIGRGLHHMAPSISADLDEDDQMVYLAGFQLAATSAVAAIDLCAAGLAYLAGHQQREPNFRRLASTPNLLNGLTPSQIDWVRQTQAAGVDRYIDVRNALVHRFVRTSVSVRIGGLPSYEIEIDEVAGKIGVDPDVVYDFAVDRCVALGLVFHRDT
jgi:hypothetical protein